MGKDVQTIPMVRKRNELSRLYPGDWDSAGSIVGGSVVRNQVLSPGRRRCGELRDAGKEHAELQGILWKENRRSSRVSTTAEARGCA
jgi:hypothetical protein